MVLEGGGTILKQAPFWGVNFSLMRTVRGVKFYDTATAVYSTGFITETKKRKLLAGGSCCLLIIVKKWFINIP